MSLISNLRQPIYFLKTLRRKRLKISTLDGGWYDRDDLILHAAFQCLVDFVEREDPGETIDWEHDEVHSAAWKEIGALYDWWKNVYPVVSERPEYTMEGPMIEDSHLHRLVEIRGYLWT